MIDTIEKRADGDLEDHGYLIEASATDPVRTVFVFLYLLEGNADLGGQVRLRHAAMLAQNPDVSPDQGINDVFSASRHKGVSQARHGTGFR